VTKIGAEGVQAIGIRSQGLGIAIKVADGQKRGLYPTIVAVLDQLGLLDSRAREQLSPWGHPKLTNYRGTQTGKVCGVVVLDKR
jgi:L-asparaginase II